MDNCRRTELHETKTVVGFIFHGCFVIISKEGTLIRRQISENEFNK